MSTRALRLALLDPDKAHAQSVARAVREQGWRCSWFRDADEFLLSATPYGFGLYLVDLAPEGMDGLRLIRLLRRRSSAGVVAIGPDTRAGWRAALQAGADLYLPRPADPADAALAVQAVLRRTAPQEQRALWQLQPRERRLFTPSGQSVALSENDVQLLQCFIGPAGTSVRPSQIAERLGREPSGEADNWLHATVYRLRCRVRHASDDSLPLQSSAGAGYVFRAPLAQR